MLKVFVSIAVVVWSMVGIVALTPDVPTLTNQWRRAKAAERFTKEVEVDKFPWPIFEAGVDEWRYGGDAVTSCDSQMVVGRVLSVRPYIFHSNPQVVGVSVRCEMTRWSDRWPPGSYGKLKQPEGWRVGALLKEHDGGWFYQMGWSGPDDERWEGLCRADAPTQPWYTRNDPHRYPGPDTVRFHVIFYRDRDSILLYHPTMGD